MFSTSAMSLHPVLLKKLNAALLPIAMTGMTVRDARLPAVPAKVHVVAGMRRAGKTTFLRQLQAERRNSVRPECALYLSFDDARLAGLGADQLSLLL